MRNTAGVITMLLAVTAAGCSAPAPQLTETDRQAVETEVGDWVGAFIANWSEGRAGLDRGIATFDDHPDFVFAIDSELLRSRAAAADAFTPAFQNIQSQIFEISQRAIAVLGHDLAHVALAGTVSQSYVDGSSSGPMPWAATLVLVRTEDGWRDRFIHQSFPNATPASWEEGTYQYLPPLKGQSIIAGGRLVFLYGPADGSGPMIGEAGTYTMSGDTVTNTIVHSTDPDRIGLVYKWTRESTAGDTVVYVLMNAAGEVTGRGRSVKVR